MQLKKEYRYTIIVFTILNLFFKKSYLVKSTLFIYRDGESISTNECLTIPWIDSAQEDKKIKYEWREKNLIIKCCLLLNVATIMATFNGTFPLLITFNQCVHDNQ